MSMVEAAVLVFIIALFVVFGIVLAWETHWEERERNAPARRSSKTAGTPSVPAGVRSMHQGADG